MALRRAFAIALGVSLLVTLPTVALAQDKALAETLFKEARAAMDAQDFLMAKEKLETSQRLMPGPGTLLNLGYCYERLGLPANAYRAYRSAVVLSERMQRRDRAQVANTKLVELRKSLGLVTLVVSQPGVMITVDGTVVDPAEKVPLEEGRHALRVSSTGFVPWTSEIRAEKGERLRVIIPQLTRDSSAKGAPPPAAVSSKANVTVERDDEPEAAAEKTAPPAATAEAPVDDPKSGTGMSGRRVLGIGIAGAGVAAVGVGVVLGLGAKSTYDETNAHCNDRVCDAEGVKLTDEARSSATWATVAVGAGLAAVAGGAILYFTAPKSSPMTARAGVSFASGGVRFNIEKAF